MNNNQLQITTIIALTAIVILQNTFSSHIRPANANTHEQCIRLNQGNEKIVRIAR